MSEKHTQNSEIRDYLLGNTSSTNEKFEERLMTDDEFFQEFQIEEDELIQDYADGNLCKSEKEKFEKHFLISIEREAKVEFSKSFRNHIDHNEKEKNLVIETSQNESERDTSFFSFSFIQKVFPAFATVLVLFGIVWFVFLSSDSQSPLEKEFAQKNGSEISDLKKYESKFNLLPGNFRDSTNLRKLSKAKLTDDVLFRLTLPTEINSQSSSEVQIIKNLKVIFTQKEIRKYKTESGEELRVILPGSIFEKGEYLLKVNNQEIKDSSINYPFLIE